MSRQQKTIPPVRPFRYSAPGQPLSLFTHSAGTHSLTALARKHGTPLYLYSADQMLERLGYFREALASQPHLVCYAVKANSALGILKLFAENGAGFDIVSGGELERILTVSPEAATRTVFSGVGKTAAEIDRALEADILAFNVESESELALLAVRARKQKKRARFALRVNPDVFAETHPYISTGLREHKFGIDIRRARRIYNEAASNRWLQPYGISVHIGSQIRSTEPFGAAMQRVAKLARELVKDGIRLRTVDAGGGLGIDYHAPASGKSGPKSNFDAQAKVNEYAEALLTGLEPVLSALDIQLLIEPGRFLVAQAGALLTQVLSVKQNGRKTFVITDAAMNDLIRPALYQAHHEIVPVNPRPGPRRAVDIVGPVCETGDFFARDRKLPPVEAGDLLAILDAGAYGMAQSSNYNSRFRPAEVLIHGRKATLIRRRETTADLFAPELLPG